MQCCREWERRKERKFHINLKNLYSELSTPLTNQFTPLQATHDCRCFPPSHWRPPHRTTTHDLTRRCRCFLSPEPFDAASLPLNVSSQPLTPPQHATLRDATHHATLREGDWDQERRRARFPEQWFPRRARRRATTNRFVYLSLKFFREFLILLCGYPDGFGFYWFSWFCFVIVLCFVVVLILP